MRFAIALVSLVVPHLAHAQPLDDGPKSPQDSLKCIQVRPGFLVELMAHEPVVQDPIAFAWGPDGKFWVVEMGDYPLGTADKKGGGRIKILEKSRADGPYDKATLFMDGLSFPTGVTPWKKGVLVTCAPDIFYAEDTDRDGKADKKEVLFTGFKEGNQQHRVNGLVYGLDGWYYGANGDSGGEVTSVKTGKKVDIRGRDFRLKPDTGEFETATGQTQFGRCRDDFGNWFGCNNSNPLYHFVLEEHYMSRNPYLIPPPTKIDVSVTPGASRVYPISKPQPRFNTPAGLNHFTSACSAMIYRDDFFGPEFYGNSFVCEPVHNLIHREVMERKGITFTSRRADDEKESEFLASSDNWFRPATVALGPDGCLWIADMYRQVIEHPEWIPKDWQKKVDLRAGHDKGRIYRVRPKDKTPANIPIIAKMSVKQLIDSIQSPNGWTRDQAQQHLASAELENESAIYLMMVMTTCPQPAVRAQTYGVVKESHLPQAAEWLLADKDAGVRRLAIRAAADWMVLRKSNLLLKGLEDRDPAVRLEAMFACGEAYTFGKHARELGLAAGKQANEPYFLTAALSSAGSNGTDNFQTFLNAFLTNSETVPPALLAVAYRMDSSLTIPIVLHRLVQNSISDEEAMSSFVAAFSLTKDRPNVLFDKIERAIKAANHDGVPRLGLLASLARRTLADEKANAQKQLTAIRFLGCFARSNEDARSMAKFLDSTYPDDVQAAAMEVMTETGEPGVMLHLLKRWKQLSPRIRTQATDFALTTELSSRILLDQLDSKQIAPAEIDSIRRTKLTDHPVPAIRERARKLFGAATDADRAKVVNDYWLHQFKKGDSASGAKVFAKQCAVCHKFDGKGQDVGPDLAAVKDRSPEALLVAILDPNRAVEARYLNYVAVTKSGKTLTGILAQETGNSITLVAADGKRHDLLRTDLESLASTGKSLMPEGMEKELPPRDFADLIEYLKK